ncbi:MAG: carbohydrate porin [Rhodocyclaceae bacterium]|nr:MAG: carbohydrate porin [Rhodocyclaceae bacterium]
MKMLSRKQVTASIGLLVTLALPLAATAEVPPDYANATLSGDWNGARSTAWRSGWAWDAALKVDTLHSSGGIAPGSRGMSQLDLRLAADLGKIAGWEGATAYLHVLDDRGAGINARQTGSLMGVSNIEVPVPTTRIFHAWLQQNFLDDRVSLLAGLYPIDSEFFAMESASLLLHPSFGTPADLALTRGPSIFNNSAFGLRGKWLSADQTVYAMGALLDGIPNDPAHPRRTAIRFAKGDGAFVIAEMGWMPNELGHLFEPNEPVHGLPTPALVRHAKYSGVSKYAIGLWRYGNRVPDQLDVDASNEPLQRYSQGAYLLAERTLLGFGGAGRDLAAFARYSLSDGNSAAIDRMWNLGLRLRGPSAGRPDDAVVIGWTHARLANKWRSVQATAGTSTTSGEETFEVSWRAMLNPWLALQPNLQSIRHPGGGANAPRATVIGLRLELTL